MSKIKPYSGYVLVEEEDQTPTFKSGIEIKDDENEHQSVIGKVIEVPEFEDSSRANHISIEDTDNDEKRKDVGRGDKIVFKKYTGNEIEFEDKKYQLIAYADILAVIK